MRVLNRHEDEAIIIQIADGEIVVSVERVNSSQTLIGIETPQSVKILREELYGNV